MRTVSRRPFSTCSHGSSTRFERSHAERVARLDHIRASANGGARGKQNEPRHTKARGAEIAARRKILGNLLTGGFAQTCQCYLRRELAPLGLQADTLHQPFLLG